MTGTSDVNQFRGMTRSKDDITEVVQSPNLDPTNGDGSNPMEPEKMSHECREELIKSECLRFANTIKETLTRDKHIEFLRIMRDFHKKRIDFAGIREKAVELFEGHPELLVSFNSYLPEEFKLDLPEEVEVREPKKPILNEVAMNFVNNMKMGLQNNYDIYISFLEILNLYRMGKRSVFQVHQEVVDLLGDHEDLIKEFTSLYPDYYNARNQRRITHKSYVRSLEEAVFNLFPTDMHDRVVSLCKTVKEQSRNPDEYLQFLKCVKHYQTDNINSQQLQSLVHDLLQDHPHLVKEFFEVINHSDKTEDDNVTKVEEIRKEINEKGKRKRSATSSTTPTLEKGKRKRSQGSKKDEKEDLPLSKRDDLFDCKSCTPSYRHIPEDYTLPATSQREQLDKQVLNDHWVLFSCGHEFKHPLKNMYEKKLAVLEDERHDMDLASEGVNDTIDRAEKVLRMISDKSIETDAVFPLEEYFPGPSLRCIKLIYGAHGIKVIEELKNNVRLNLPKILRRLKQKQAEWRVFSSGFNQHWKPVFAANHQMSLDHLDGYLEHQDSKFLCRKDLLDEINNNDINKLEFKYSDMNIHKDLYQLIKLSCSDVFSSEQLDRAMKIWTSLVESIFGQKETRGKDHEFLINETDCYLIVDLEKGESASYMNDIEQNHDQEGVSTVETSSNDRKEDLSMIFYGNDAFYIFFRLHQILYQRLEEAKRSTNDSYPVFFDLLRNYLSGAYKEKYENECRTIFGNPSGFIFSIERLIKRLSIQFRTITINKVANKLLDLYASEKAGESGRFVDEVYAANARLIVSYNKMFRFECLRIPDTNQQTRSLTIQQIDPVPYKPNTRGKRYPESCSDTM